MTGWQLWEPLIPLLSAQHRVVNVQLYANAQGLTGQLPDSDYTTDLERESVRLAVAEAIGADPFHLVGISNGGRAAIDYVLAHGEPIRSLTVIEPAAWWLATAPDAAEFDRFVRRIAGTDLSAEDVEEFLIRAGLGPVGTDFEALPQWPVWYAARNALSWFNDRALDDAQAGIAGWSALTLPTLCVRGDATSPWLKSVVDVLMAGWPNAKLLELPGGHVSPLQNPEAFVAAVSEHVAAAS
jgi:pimeloyl-ACP methyl ester carboxylesterase